MKLYPTQSDFLKSEEKCKMEDTITITFSGQINVQSVKEFIESIKNLNIKNPDSNKLVVYISSPGGDVELAIELYNFIKSMKCKVTMINMSYVSSAAVIVFLAGDERISLPFSSFYVHSISKKLDGNFTITDLDREIREMKLNTNKIIKLLEVSTLKPKSYWKSLMSKGSVIAAEKAVKVGLIQYIKEYE